MANNSANMTDTLKRLADIVDSRKQDVLSGKVDPSVSYIAKLFSKGDDAILKKVGEEATEVALAAKDCRFAIEEEKEQQSQKQKLLVGEVADLWFHCLITLSQFGLRPEDVLAELERREGTSGIAEKASRQP